MEYTGQIWRYMGQRLHRWDVYGARHQVVIRSRWVSGRYIVIRPNTGVPPLSLIPVTALIPGYPLPVPRRICDHVPIHFFAAQNTRVLQSPDRKVLFDD